MIKFKLELDLSNLDKITNNNLKKGQEILINSIQRDCEKYVPFKSGALKNTTIIENDNKELVYTRPYSRFQYYGRVMTDYEGRTWVSKGEKKPIITTRHLVYKKSTATERWFETAKKIHLDKWIKEVKDTFING